MRTQVALYFFMKWNLHRVVSLCLNKQDVLNRQVEQILLLYKDSDQKEMIGFDCICL